MSIHTFPSERVLFNSLPKAWLDSPYSEYLDFRLTDDGKETAFELAFKDHFIGNPSIRAFHGGVIASFSEISAQIYLQNLCQDSELKQAETITVDYLRPCVEGVLTAIPRTIRVGKCVSSIMVNIMQNGKLAATSKVIFVK